MPMEERLREEIAGWLEFYRELGIDEFYRRRAVEKPEVRSQKLEESAPMLDPESRTPSPEPRAPIPGPRLVAPRALSLFEAPPPARRERETLAEIRADLGDCRRCKLAAGRQHIVFGQGNPHAEVVFVGEGPGADEDAQGLPFVGRAGQLLNKMLQLVGIKREDVYICNVVKCRPPGNRTPERDEVEACSPFLYRQIEAIRPRLVCCLGAPAVKTVLGLKEGILKLRGRFYDFAGAKALATVHPAYILRNPREEKILREDFEKIRDFLRQRPNA
ncbi:MAG TPA: uracil-DNA glycosylase [Terriglobia bacterium]|nr:uracil-DNA glycosylase [Terriglobia bacterium]